MLSRIALFGFLLIFTSAPAFAKDAKKTSTAKKASPHKAEEAPAPAAEPVPEKVAEEEPAQKPSPGQNDNTQAEAWHMAHAGTFELMPYTAFRNYNETYPNTDKEANNSLFLFGAQAEYGISDMFSIWASSGYGVGTNSIENCPALTTCESTKSSGFTDPIIGLDLRIPMSFGSLRANLNYSYSPGDYEIETDGDTNLYTGGSELELDLGFEASAGEGRRHWFGAEITYDLMSEDIRVDDKDTPSKYKVESKPDLGIGGFYEFHLPKLTIGGAFDYTMSPESTKNTNGVKTKQKDKFTSLGFTAYVPVFLTEKFTLLPSLTASSIDYKQDSGAIKSATVGVLSCAFRFIF